MIFKVQILHDYLIDTGLIPEESLDVWANEAEIMGAADAEYDSHHISESAQVNITIEDFPYKLDVRRIKFAIKWWLDVYEPEPAQDKPRFKMSEYPKTSTTADIWIDLELTESSTFNNGKIRSCYEQLIIENKELQEDFILILKNMKSGEEIQLLPKA